MNRKIFLILVFTFVFTLLFFSILEAKTITENEMGIHDGYDYEYWKDSGYGSMTLGSGGTFSCQWSNINNILFRKGRKFDQTKTHQEIGNITIEYGVDYNPSGNSYLCVYGWTVEPLVEYYIVESWGSWRPPGATAKGTITVDGGVYDIYETTRENQPSIIGTATFQQYWSVRRERKTSGTVSVSEHFKKWESMGMPMGKMYEVALTIEGYQSSGTADVYKNNLILGSSDEPGQPDSRSAFETIEAEEYNRTSSGTLEIIGTGSGGRGIGYIESGDTVTYSGIDFGDEVGEFIIRYASDVDDTKLELRLGSPSGTLLGTFSVESTGGWNDYIESSMKINKVTGAHDLVLCFTGPVNIDWFKFTSGGDVDPGVSPGDLNGDGFINTSDYVLLRRYLLGIGNISSNADVNADGAINSMDYVYVRQYILEIIDSFPGEDDEDLAKLFEGIQLAISYKDFNNHNPIMTHRFGADPYALVYEDRVYVYSTHDIIHRDSNGMIRENDYSQIRTLNRLSSEDLVNWTDHGVIEVAGPSGKAQWADKSWAPAAIYKNIDGKDRFFLYFANNANGVGVLTGDNPVGPFTDPIGRPLVSRWTPNIEGVPWLFDPAVIIDDNGTGYLYFGGGVPEGKEAMPGSARVVKLSEDMISLAGIPEVVEAPYFFEAAFVNKIGDTYYYSYCSNWADRNSAGGQYKPSPASIAYMTSKNPMGPWEYRGEIFENPGHFFGVWGNNHHSIIEFKGQWYLFYHTEILRQQMGITNGYRCTHIDKLEFNVDGTIRPVIGTRRGVEQVGSLNPYQINEAETMAWSGGISTRRTNEPSYRFGPINMVVSDMSTGSFIGLAGVDFGVNGPDTFTAKVASVTDGNVIKIVAGNINGEAIGYLKVPNTGSLDRFEEVTIRVKNVTGKKDLFFIFAGEGFYFDAWRFD